VAPTHVLAVVAARAWDRQIHSSASRMQNGTRRQEARMLLSRCLAEAHAMTSMQTSQVAAQQCLHHTFSAVCLLHSSTRHPLQPQHHIHCTFNKSFSPTGQLLLANYCWPVSETLHSVLFGMQNRHSVHVWQPYIGHPHLSNACRRRCARDMTGPHPSCCKRRCRSSRSRQWCARAPAAQSDPSASLR
jgi:hypothetical protein